MQAAKRTPVDLRDWAVGLMEKDNRKSHLAPQLSPATRELLRSTDSPTFATDATAAYTPTSGEIPIAGAIASPRDPGHAQNRSPTRNGTGSIGRSAGSTLHPGLGQRSQTSGSIPKVTTVDLTQPSSATLGTTFTLPVRPAPPGGPLPPPPPRKETPDELRRENRRQATFIPPTNGGSYGSAGHTPR